MNRCETIQNELKAYLDGQLPFLQRQQVRRHLKRCVACREELSAMEQTGNQLKVDAPTPLEASLRAKILAAAGSVGPKPGERPKAPSKWRRKPMMVWAVAATALTAWCIIYPLTHFTQPQFRQQQVAMTRAASAPNSDSALYRNAGTPQSGGVGGAGGGGVGGGGAPAASAVSPAPMSHMMKIMPGSPPAFNPNSVGVTSDYWKTRSGSADEAQMRRNVAMAKADEAAAAPGAAAPEAPPHTPVMMEKMEAMKKSPLVDGHAKRRWVWPSSLDIKTLNGYVQDYDETTRTVHKEAQITVQVDNVEAKSEAVEQIVQGVGGYVAENNLNTGDDGLKTASLTLKVPVAQFQSVLNQVARQGEVKAKSLSGQDLTEEISDQKQSEHTLREDVQATQQQLTQRLSRMGREERLDTLRELRTQVAQKQARLKLLHKLGTLSTISVELDEKPRPVPVQPHTSGFMNEMNETLHDAAQSMVQAARLPILTFVWILAYAPLWILLILGYRWAVRR